MRKSVSQRVRFIPATLALAVLIFSTVCCEARRVSLEGVGISIRYTDRTYRYKSDHLDTASWDLGLIFPKSPVPAAVSGMEFATHDFRPASDDSRTNDVIDRIKADAAGDLLIAMPSAAASGNGWVRLNGGVSPDFYLDKIGRYTAPYSDTNSPYWFYKRTYTTPDTWVLLPTNSVSTNHPPFVFANKGELYWENPPILPGAVILVRKPDGGGSTTVANPNLLILSNGDYVAGISGAIGTSGTSLWRSVNRGTNWTLLKDGLSVNRDSVFEHQGSIYVVGWNTSGGGTRIYKSSNLSGGTWTSSVFSGEAGGDAPSHVDVVNGRIWKVATVDITGGVAPGFLSAPVGADLMVDANWTRSAPGATWGAMIGTYTLANGEKAEVINEPEGTLLVTKEGRLVNATKCNIYRPADGWNEGFAMIYADQGDFTRTEIDTNYAGPRLPGSTSKYTVRYDPVSGRYWALTSGGVNRGELNLYSASSAGGKIGDFQFEQRVLQGHSTGYHGFNYPFMQFDGDDIVFSLRTAWDHSRGTSDRWHDADLFTFHRIANFRGVVGPSYVVNPGFEEGMTGWQTLLDADADYTQTNNPHAGTNNLAHYKTSAYQVKTYQSVSKPNGVYTASAWVKCSGGQNQCYFYVSGYGGAELRTNITANSTYVQIMISEITVSSGVCTLGVYSDANAGNWVTVDDVALIELVPEPAVWTNLAGGSWATAGNWSNQVVANAADVPADFSTLTLGAHRTVTLDGVWTVGRLTFGDMGGSYDWTLHPGTGGSLTLAGLTSPVITVNDGNAMIAVELAGTDGLIKAGAGVLTLAAGNTYAGNTVVSNGILLVNGSLAAGSVLTVQPNTTLGGSGTIGGAVTFNAGSFAQLTPGAPLTLANSLTVAATGTLPVVQVNLTNNVPPGNYPLMTYNPAGSSGAFAVTPVIVSGSVAAGTVATVTTSGGVVSLVVINQPSAVTYARDSTYVTQWYFDGGATISGADGPTPVVTAADINGTFYGTFNDVTLAVGDRLIYTFTYKTTGTTTAITSYRFALWNSGGNIGPAYAGDKSTWTGFWGDNDSLQTASGGTQPFNFGGLAAASLGGAINDTTTYNGSNGITTITLSVERTTTTQYTLTCTETNSGVGGDTISTFISGTIDGYNVEDHTFNTWAMYFPVAPTDTSLAVQLNPTPETPSAPGFPADAIEATGGTVSLTATGALGSTYKLWASPDVTLTPIESTWSLLTNGTITTSPFMVTDPGAHTNQQRFYLFSAP